VSTFPNAADTGVSPSTNGALHPEGDRGNVNGKQLTFCLPVFEGPLDLLLHLIREQKIEITDIPIAQITEQYLAYLALMEALDLDVAGEFVVMAATLLEIKSRMLLPRPPADPDDPEALGPDPREELVQRLLEYEQYKAAAGQFRLLEELRRQSFFREPAEPEELSRPLVELTPADLVHALERMLAAAGEDGGEITTLARETINLRLRMREIWAALTGWEGPLPFRALFEIFCSANPSRIEIVVSFLAILELLRAGRICVRQAGPLGEIYLSRREEEAVT
jgi:segregation and condensation protein A